MTTCIYSHPSCAKHDPEPMLGFAPRRLECALEKLRALKDVQWREAPLASLEYIELVHTPRHIETVLQPLTSDESRLFDAETFAMHGTAEATLHATGQVIAATEAVASGNIRNAFCVVSPGGHHAEAEHISGYCFFNHVAIAAAMAQKHLNMPRVAVLDFDTHHGNGTQSLFWNHQDRFFVSVHEQNLHSGLAEERGAWNNILNLPLPPGSTGADLREAMITQAFPVLTAFRPDILFVSAGFDMHKDDPLGQLALGVDDYCWLGQEVTQLADTLCNGRMVAVMEGGYNLDLLGDCVAAFVGEMVRK